ncbi:MAG: FAD:protein FMN transferase [Treponema sp.]|jgi:thiamine biosynthesis lipoprotein|nr:FAD:protein FMN transferase [Treponema sp.]
MYRLLLPLFASLCLSCSGGVPARREFVLGTVCSVNLFETGTRAEYGAIFSEFHRIQGMMALTSASFGEEDQEATALDLINKNAGIRAVKAPEELLDVLERALYYAELSGGAFDPTVGPLVRLWGVGGESPRVPGAGEIQEALSLVDWRDLLIDRDAGTAFLRRRGQSLDLGAIAKGYAADRAAAILREKSPGVFRLPGKRRAVINLGGNVFALGERRGWKNWRIGIQDPLEERDIYLGVLELKDKSVVTSGVYERFFEEGGRRYHHILSTADGYPVRNGLLSVTIIADGSIDADALSTAAFALGAERGLALVEALPDTEAVFVREDKTVILSSGAPFRLLDGGNYRLVSLTAPQLE